MDLTDLTDLVPKCTLLGNYDQCKCESDEQCMLLEVAEQELAELDEDSNELDTCKICGKIVLVNKENCSDCE